MGRKNPTQDLLIYVCQFQRCPNMNACLFLCNTMKYENMKKSRYLLWCSYVQWYHDQSTNYKRIKSAPHDKTNKMVCVPSEDSDQPWHMPSLIRVFAIRSMGSWMTKVSTCRQQRLWSDRADDLADMSLRWRTGNFFGFVMRLLKWVFDDNSGIIFNISP